MPLILRCLLSVLPAVLAALVASCSLLSPDTITLSRDDIARRAFLDRRSGELDGMLKGLGSVGVNGPEVGFATGSGRVEFTWTAHLASGPIGVPLNVAVSVSGVPVLNEARDGLDLDDTRVDSVRIPFIATAALPAAAGQSLGRLPLLTFDPQELNRDGVLYRPDHLSLGRSGLKVKLVEK